MDTPITIYCGEILPDICTVVSPLGEVLVFEDHFSYYTWFNYGPCWRLLGDAKIVICKTRDAIAAAPANVKIIKVGRSVRTSDNGTIVQNEMTKEEFLAIY